MAITSILKTAVLKALPKLSMIQVKGAEPFWLDCEVESSLQMESEITEYPTESGSNVADNIRPKPKTVTMRSIVSDSPIGDVVKFRDDADKPSTQMYQRLQKIFADRDVCTIRTSLDIFKNMGMKSLDITRDASTGAALAFSSTWIEVITVENKRVFPRTSTPDGKGTKKITKPPAEDPFKGYITVDTKNLVWWDAAIDNGPGITKGGWRQLAVFKRTEADSVVDVLHRGVSGQTGKWFLYHGQIEDQGAHPVDDASFDSLRFNGKHPTRNLRSLTPGEYVIAS